MKASLSALLLILGACGCSSEENSTLKSPPTGQTHTLSLSVERPAWGLDAATFDLDPVGVAATFTCSAGATNFEFKPVDAGGGHWTFTGSVPSDCVTPTVKNVRFKRHDYPDRGVRVIDQGATDVADPLGGASYSLDTATLTVDYWGDDGTVSSTLTVDHDVRFASSSFAFAGGNSCTVQLGSLDLAATKDRFTITMPQDNLITPDTMTGSGDATFISATNNGTSIDYLFSFATLAPDLVNAYHVTVNATWNSGANSCGGTLTFKVDHKDFN